MTPEEIKAKILELSKEYYRQVRPDRKRAGYVPALGKKLGEEELCNMVEASLDMKQPSKIFHDFVRDNCR